MTEATKTRELYISSYVYTYASSLTGKVFYVGRGSDDRYLTHFRQAIGKGTKLSRVAQMTRSILQQGGKVIIRKPYNNIPHGRCLEQEKTLILHYGYDQLVNLPHWRYQTKST